jgi:hypothetical protein
MAFYIVTAVKTSNFTCSVRQLLVNANVVSSSSIFVTLMMEAMVSSETSVSQEPHGVTFQKTAFFK